MRDCLLASKFSFFRKQKWVR